MFWKKKPRASTRLEKVCSEVDSSSLQAAYEKSPDNSGLPMALAMIILNAAGDIKNGLLSEDSISELMESNNPDILIVESAALIHSQVAYSIMDELDELTDEENEEFTDAIFKSLVIITTLVTQLSGFENLRTTMSSRTYSQNPEKALDLFVNFLLSSRGKSKPIERIAPNPAELSLAKITLKSATIISYSTIIIATIEVIKKFGLAHFNNEI